MASRVRRDAEGTVIDKWCVSCQRWRRAAEFSKSRRYSVGLHFECKECKAKRAAKDYEVHKEDRLANAAKYRELNKDKIREIRAAYLPKRRARRASAAEETKVDPDIPLLAA